MIRVVTLDEFDPIVIKELRKVLFTAFGVGCEHLGPGTVPASLHEPFDAQKLMEAMPKVTAFADDKVLYLTSRKLAPRKLASGEVPTFGLSQYNGQRCIVSTAQVKNLTENVKTVARYAMQELGHTFGLHHCLDPRCSMYAQWTPTYVTGEAIFCVFCREQTEQKIRAAKS